MIVGIDPGTRQTAFTHLTQQGYPGIAVIEPNELA